MSNGNWRERGRTSPQQKLMEELDRYDNKTSGADVFLATMFSQIAYMRGIGTKENDQFKWTRLLSQYIKKFERWRAAKLRAKGQDPEALDDQTKSNIRGNIQKQLSLPNMTWKTFCKGMRLLQISKIDIRFRVYTWDNKVTTHEHVLQFTRDDERSSLTIIQEPVAPTDVSPWGSAGNNSYAKSKNG